MLSLKNALSDTPAKCTAYEDLDEHVPNYEELSPARIYMTAPFSAEGDLRTEGSQAQAAE